MQQCFRRQYNTIADIAGYVVTQNAGWNEVKDGLFTVNNESMTRIIV
jgi:hypothetical protein